MKKTFLIVFTLLILTCLQGCIAHGENRVSTGGAVPQERERIQAALQQMVDAYQQKNLRAVIANVADDFTGDQSAFEDRIRKDFSLHHDISIRYTLDNVTPDQKDSAFVVVTFTRSHMDVRTTEVVTLTGRAEMVFKRRDGVYRLWSIKPSTLFGLDN